MGKKGQKTVVSHLEYHCKKCNYKVESTAMTSAEMKPMRADGSLVSL